MRSRSLLFGLICLSVALLGNECGDPTAPKHEDIGYGLFASPEIDTLALSADGSRLYVAKTLSNEIYVIDTASGTVLETILVGVDPGSLELRPDGNELWVANHVSDSISIIDTNPVSGTFHEVIDTIQDLDANGVTNFDEPTDIAFFTNSKAYVSLSSRNDIAVIDVGTRAITKRVHITAQEPRALAVLGNKLFVAAFESNNQSEISACPLGQSAGEPADNCTLDQGDINTFATNPNIPGAVKNIIIDDDLPDRDLFVFNTSDESVFDTISGVGTLLYGLAVDNTGRVFVSQTDARNAVNGIEPANLIDLDNRLFLNQIAELDCSGGSSCSFNAALDVHDLEEAPGTPVTTPLATPYGITVSDDDTTLVVTAAGSSRIATIDATDPSLTGILDTLDVGAIPRSVELHSDSLSGAPLTAYVHNNLDLSVSVVDVSDPSNISLVQTISLGGSSIPANVRAGRIAFNDAKASSSGTFSCASCHPDGNTDQLLWRIGGKCELVGCSGDDEPRTTMPIRGLKNTIPLHWDGTLGDPFGGGNGAVGFGGSGGSDCTLGDADGDHDCFRDLVNESLMGVMCEQMTQGPNDVCNVTGPSGQLGLLTNTERENMAFFLAGVSYPPARSRATTDLLSVSADNGFRDFFMDQGGSSSPNTCADSDAGCHELPLGVAHNSPGLNGFDAPTMRGMTDRFLQFSMGISAAEESQLAANLGGSVIPYSFAAGMEEDAVLSAAFVGVFTPVYNVGPLDIFQMVEEASTGTSGAVGRQVQLDGTDTDYTLLDELELADDRGLVSLRGNAMRMPGLTPITISYKADTDVYQVGPEQVSRALLETRVNSGNLRGVLTAHLPTNFDAHPQPLIGPIGNNGPTGDPNLDFSNPLSVTGTDVHQNAVVLVDGLPVSGSVSCTVTGSFCDNGTLSINFGAGLANGTHFVQLQNPEGPLSNELPVCEGPGGGCL